MRVKRLVLAMFLALPLGSAEGDFQGALYRRGTQKAEKLFTLEAQRGPQPWIDHYRDAQGQDAVIERVFFRGGEAVRYEFDDRQRGGLGSVDVDGQDLRLRWDQDGSVKERRVPRPKILIFGPLYPGLLSTHWDALLAGRSIEATVPVLSAERLMTATLAFRRLPKKDRGDGSMAVEMKPANWFVALFFPPIDLHFDPATRRLLNVQGMSLLREKKGEDWVMTEVDLDYRYEK